METILFEHRFWLQILGDHARFILNALSPQEKEAIGAARCFMETFDRLLRQAREAPDPGRLDGLTACAFESASNLRAFKLDLLRRHLCGEVRVSLSPTFFNHMVNELEEYLRILESLLAGDPPPLCHPVHHHLLWVPDAVGHAATIACRLDMAEKDLKERGDCFAASFEALWGKAVELKGYLRSGVEEFPALGRYNRQVEKEMLLFTRYLAKIRDLVVTKKALSVLMPLVPDHMLREECYFLTKLAQVTELPCPACDPTRPRLET